MLATFHGQLAMSAYAFRTVENFRTAVRASSGRLEIFVYQGCARLTVGLLGLCDLRVQAAGALFAVVRQTVAETPIIRVLKIN